MRTIEMNELSAVSVGDQWWLDPSLNPSSSPSGGSVMPYTPTISPEPSLGSKQPTGNCDRTVGYASITCAPPPVLCPIYGPGPDPYGPDPQFPDVYGGYRSYCI